MKAIEKFFNYVSADETPEDIIRRSNRREPRSVEELAQFHASQARREGFRVSNAEMEQYIEDIFANKHTA